MGGREGGRKRRERREGGGRKGGRREGGYGDGINCKRKKCLTKTKSAFAIIILNNVYMYNVIFLFYRLRMSYTVLHSISLLDYYPNGVGGVQYLSITNIIVIAGWSDDKGTV